MAVDNDSANRQRRGCEDDHPELHSSLDDRDRVSGTEVGLPDRASPVGNNGSYRGVSGGLSDRGVADVVCLSYGSKLPGDGLRSDIRAIGMEVGVDERDGQILAPKAAALGRDGPVDCSVGWLC